MMSGLQQRIAYCSIGHSDLSGLLVDPVQMDAGGMHIRGETIAI
jgi:hypothetical protein